MLWMAKATDAQYNPACSKIVTSFDHWQVQENNIDFFIDLLECILNKYCSGYVY